MLCLIRAAVEADLTRIAAIYEPYVRTSVITFELEAPSVDEWRRRFGAVTEAGLPFLVLEVDRTVIGYAYCSPWKQRPAYRWTVEDSVYLDAGHRGRGFGGRLLDRLIAEAGARGIREVIAVIADTGDPTSVALHAGRGFVQAGRLEKVGHKFERWVDTILMQCSIPESQVPIGDSRQA